MGSLIELDQVEKTFVVRTKAGRLRRTRKLVRAVDDVSFSVAAGSTVGYIGPNGARRMLQPFLTRDSPSTKRSVVALISPRRSDHPFPKATRTEFLLAPVPGLPGWSRSSNSAV